MKKIKSLFNNMVNKIEQYINGKDEYYFLRVSYLFLGFVFSQSFVTSLLFIFHIKIGIYNFILGILFWITIYYLLFYKRTNNKKLFYNNLFFSLVLIIFILVSSALLLENSWDGWSYHIPSVIEMGNGWNPIYNHDESIKVWSLHYPKFIWMYGAVLYNVFGSMSMGTSFNIIISFSTFFIMLHFLIKMGFKTINAFIYSLFISFNFISVKQYFSYYNDGVQGVCIVAVIMVIFYIIKKKVIISGSEFLILFLITSMYLSVLANIKYNGALYAFLLATIILAFLFIKKTKNSKIILLSIVLGVFVLIPATTSYLPNYIYHHNIGYPIIGKDKVDIIDKAVPGVVKNDGKFLAFVKSIICDGASDKYCKVKTVYNININDIKISSIPDNLLNSFGPFYHIIFIAFILIICNLLLNLKKYKSLISKENIKEKISALIVLLVIIVFFYVTPATWWLRYVPYMYSLPIILMILSQEKILINKVTHVLWLIIILVYSFNILIFGATRVGFELIYVKNYHVTISELKNYSKDNDIYFKVYDEKNTYYKKKVREEIFKNNNIYFKDYDDNQKCRSIKRYYVFGIELYECD